MDARTVENPTVAKPTQKQSVPKGFTPFQPGQSGNPGGKPTASRNRLQGRFLRDLAEDFEEHGKKAIIATRENDPAAYVRAIVALMPKEVLVTHDAVDDLSDDQLDAAIAAVRAVLAAKDPGAQEREAAGREPAPAVSALSEAS